MDSPLEQIGQRLDALDSLIRNHSSSSEVFEHGLRTIVSIFPGAESSIWLAGDSNTCLLQTANWDSEDNVLVAGEAASELRQVQRGERSVWTSARFVSGKDSLWIGVANPSEATPSDLQRETIAEVAECLADQCRRDQLTRSLQYNAVADSLSNLTHSVYAEPDWQQQLQKLSAGAREALNATRVSIIQRDTGKNRVLSVSGTQRLDPQSDVLVSISDVSTHFDQDEHRDQWCSINEFSESCPALLRLGLSVDGAIRVQNVNSDHVLCVEAHDEQADEKILGLVAYHASRILDRSPKSFWKSIPSRISKRIWLLIASVCAIVWLWMPTEFELEVEGQLMPRQRFNVFAPSDGVVEQLFVDNETDVENGAPLVSLRDEELELEIERISGQIATEESRLTALTRSRGTDVEGGRESERAIQERIKGLNSQMKLLTAREQALLLTAKSTGVVIGANLREELTARPVRRGQKLFEIVVEDSDWQVELNIEENNEGYVRQAMQTGSVPLRVRLRGVAQQKFETQVNRLNAYVEWKADGAHCKAFADVPAEFSSRRPGATVVARVNCGRRARGFVLFRQIIELLEEKLFVWFG